MNMNKPSLRVAQVIGSAGPGGAETFYVRLISALADSDDIEILPIVRQGSWVETRLKELGIDYRSAAFGGLFDFQTRKDIQVYVEQFDADVIQSWMNRATRFLPKVAVPKVARLGGYYKLKYYKNKVEYLIGNTKDICDYLVREGWQESRAVHIPNFATQPPLNFADDKLMVRDRYGITGRQFVVLLAGRMHECKGFDTAIYALRHLPANVHLILVGDGAQKDALKSMVEADGLSKRVTFVDWVNRISPLAAAADMWLSPSRVEPLGNTVLDAWAHDRPIAASRAVGPANLIEDGVDGLLFDIEDDQGLAACVQKFMQDEQLRNACVQAGKEKFMKNFTRDVVARQYIAFYNDLKIQQWKQAS